MRVPRCRKAQTFITMVEDVVKDAGRIDVLDNNFGTSNPRTDLNGAMIEKAIVHKDGQITSVFQNGTEINVGEWIETIEKFTLIS